jgi:hypothetical protein
MAAVAERPVGLGRVSLLASPLTPDWNTLPFKPAFLPFIHGWVAYLGQGPNRDLNVRVGQPMVWELEGERESVRRGQERSDPPAARVPGEETGRGMSDTGHWIFEGPGDRRMRLQSQQESHSDAPGRSVRLESAPRAGFYRLRRLEAAPAARRNLAATGGTDGIPSGDSTVAWFAANLDAEESDLRSLSRAELENRLRPAALRWVDPHELMAAVVQEGRQGREAWRGLLLAAVALMICESGMAQMFGRRRSDV